MYMFQLKKLVFIVLIGCAIPLLGMNEINKTSWQSDAADAIVPTIEATIMTTLATLPQAMMYVPLQDAVAFTLNSGAMTGCISTIGYALPSILFSYMLGPEQRNNLAKQPKKIEWKKPLSIALALLTTFFMLAVNQRTLIHNHGI